MFRSLLGQPRDSMQAKRLAARMIPKFAHLALPTVADEGLDALIDLCEDEETAVRGFVFSVSISHPVIQAMHSDLFLLPVFCVCRSAASPLKEWGSTL